MTTSKQMSQATKELIRYARETGKVGRPSDAVVEQHIEATLWFIYNHTYGEGADEEEPEEEGEGVIIQHPGSGGPAPFRPEDEEEDEDDEDRAWDAEVQEKNEAEKRRGFP